MQLEDQEPEFDRVAQNVSGVPTSNTFRSPAQHSGKAAVRIKSR
jgi:hypothetical protein